MHKKQLMTRKPAYKHGQLLLADDFIAEQRYHVEARYRHSRNLHGSGVVRGLVVTRAGDTSIGVSPGYVIDSKGREVELAGAEVLELHGARAQALLSVTLGYATEPHDSDGEDGKAIECFAVLRASEEVTPGEILLATVQLDDRGRLGADSISTAKRHGYRTFIAPGSVNAASLDDHLRRGWLRMPFRPTTIPQDQSNALPPFRVGATETVAHREIDKQPNTRGAGGTMAILLPPQATHIHRLRVAGAANEKKLKIELVKGGWDPHQKKHVATQLVLQEIEEGTYDKTWPVPADDGGFDLECSTLSLELRAEGYARVSLIAIEVSY